MADPTPDDVEYSQVRYEVVGPVARVTLNRPERRNAQSRILREELDEAFARAGQDDGIRVVVLAGEGEHFSSGHDLGTAEELADRERRPPGSATLRSRYARLWDMNIDNTLGWRDFPKPTIAQVQGYCIFAGWFLASAMDIIVSSDDALFLPELFQFFTVPWDIGTRKSKEVLLEGRFLTAREANELGFVNRVVPRDELESEVMGLAGRIAENDSFDLQMIKQAINGTQDTMGFRKSIEESFLRYALRSEAERERNNGEPAREGRRRPRVAKALAALAARRSGDAGSGA